MTTTEILELKYWEIRLIEKAERVFSMHERGLETFQAERDLSNSINAMHRYTQSKLNDDSFYKEIKQNAALK